MMLLGFICVFIIYFVCSFSRVQFALTGQEEQDFSFSEDNFLFFLSGDMRGMNTGTLVCMLCIRELAYLLYAVMRQAAVK